MIETEESGEFGRDAGSGGGDSFSVGGDGFSVGNCQGSGYSDPIYSRSFGEDGVKASLRQMYPSCH